MVGLRQPLLKKINYVLDNEGAKPKAALEKLQKCYSSRKSLNNVTSKQKKQNEETSKYTTENDKNFILIDYIVFEIL